MIFGTEVHLAKDLLDSDDAAAVSRALVSILEVMLEAQGYPVAWQPKAEIQMISESPTRQHRRAVVTARLDA